MQFIKDQSDQAHIVTGIDRGAIRVDEEIVQTSLVLSANSLTPWPVQGVNALNVDHWDAVLLTEPEIILLGTGDTLVFPEPAQLKSIYDRRIGIEVMDTQAACRTYNLLIHEGRKVTAALIL